MYVCAHADGRAQATTYRKGNLQSGGLKCSVFGSPFGAPAKEPFSPGVRSPPATQFLGDCLVNSARDIGNLAVTSCDCRTLLSMTLAGKLDKAGRSSHRVESFRV